MLKHQLWRQVARSAARSVAVNPVRGGLYVGYGPFDPSRLRAKRDLRFARFNLYREHKQQTFRLQFVDFTPVAVPGCLHVVPPLIAPSFVAAYALAIDLGGHVFSRSSHVCGVYGIACALAVGGCFLALSASRRFALFNMARMRSAQRRIDIALRQSNDRRLRAK